MSCGTRLSGPLDSSWERRELAEALEQRGEHQIADRVRQGDCLDERERYRAERTLAEAGLSRYFDYRETRCACRAEPEKEQS